MVSRVVGDAIVHSDVSGCWSVTSLECPKGLARVEVRRGLTQIVVADTGDALAGLDEPSTFAAAACTSDGELVVMTRSSPPAIVVGARGCRTTPAGGADRDSEFLEAGQRRLLLSCCAFEAMPPALADAMTSCPTPLLDWDPEELLLAIFADLGRGAGAVIDRTNRALTTGEDHGDQLGFHLRSG